ncbi:shikimate kinase AroL [Xenorhabdus griffiniae]|uniref:Shikimate kinase 1 n=1 Tax=Xenorhabdus griffiniae TaxID=351672 RepID=A0ABY9XEJ7_9GAMM|nr:shikimate kinase AroL [Xenorhabdus griffiniae]MBD1226091.1 shikimate kinase AroL [Xenorhabdus griffiniae]MBE8585791.1 shikimate kinase AroL [Xenorhabdus griffiniae]WMV71342.1 shikimate kinase AroL [Xenorhabdus griffiniae]WNH01018.1 shikimate kinase AroL [Xenorhabdus griffiniae]
MKQTLFIVGARGAGKTTIGKLLSEALSYKFIDTDESIQAMNKMTIAELVEQYGWEHFRKLESQTLKAVSQSERVISTGGGMVLALENRQYMQQNGIVIYLQASAEVLSQRLSLNPENSQRPSLTGKSIIEEMAEILVEREPLYQECANFIVDASLATEDIVSHVKSYILNQKTKLI